MSVVIAQKDHIAAQRLSHALQGRFRHVAVARSEAELHDAVLKLRANAVIVDLELIDKKELRELCNEFHRTAVVATHRAPDDEMWKLCLELGAADCCQQFDVDGMLRAISQNVILTHAAHAA